MNLSNNTHQRYFSDGITANIIIELSRFHQFLVHASHHDVNGERPFVNAVAAGRELGVQFVVEGSVRRQAQRVRINAQLLSVDTGEHLWGERFEAKEDDIFAMQDHIVRSIAAQLSGRLQIASLESRPGRRRAAWRPMTVRCVVMPCPSVFQKPRRKHGGFCKGPSNSDPSYARAYAHLSLHTWRAWARDIDAPVTMLDHALELRRRLSHSMRAMNSATWHLATLTCPGSHMSWQNTTVLKALNLNPNNPRLLASLGIVYGFRGEPERALSYFREALAIDPHFNPAWYWRNRAVVHFIAGTMKSRSAPSSARRLQQIGVKPILQQHMLSLAACMRLGHTWKWRVG